MQTRVFLDAAYAIALSVPNDLYHERATFLADELEAEKTRMVTTHAVLLEIGNALSKQRYREAAIKSLYARAFRFYRERLDKEWGLTDCVSFVVMQDLKITEALTTDEHFQQAGFRALLLENVP